MPSHQINIKEELYLRIRALAGDSKSISDGIEELLNRNAKSPKDEILDKISESEALLLMKFEYSEGQKKDIARLFSNLKVVVCKCIANPSLYEIMGSELATLIDELKNNRFPSAQVPDDTETKKIMASHLSSESAEEKKN